MVQNASSGAVTRQLEDVVSIPGVAIKPPPPPAVSDRFCLRWGNGLLLTPGKIRWLKV
jgi:hypothetical protein